MVYVFDMREGYAHARGGSVVGTRVLRGALGRAGNCAAFGVPGFG